MPAVRAIPSPAVRIGVLSAALSRNGKMTTKRQAGNMTVMTDTRVAFICLYLRTICKP